MKYMRLAYVAVAATLLSLPSVAATIHGETVAIFHVRPDGTTFQASGGATHPGTLQPLFTVGDGQEATLGNSNFQVLKVDISGTSLTLTGGPSFPDYQGLVGPAGTVDAVRIVDINDEFGDFLSFALAAGSTIPLTASALSFGKEFIQVNFAGLRQFEAGATLTANFSVVPLPAAGLLLLSGLGLLGAIGATRRSPAPA